MYICRVCVYMPVNVLVQVRGFRSPALSFPTYSSEQGLSLNLYLIWRPPVSAPTTLGLQVHAQFHAPTTLGCRHTLGSTCLFTRVLGCEPRLPSSHILTHWAVSSVPRCTHLKTEYKWNWAMNMYSVKAFPVFTLSHDLHILPRGQCSRAHGKILCLVLG